MEFDLELSNVKKVYDNGTTAVEGFDLAVSKGEFVAFLGPSGCGKSTTLRMIAGFESISWGEMRIRGKRMNEVPPARRPTSMIFQNYALFPHMTVRQNVAYGLQVKGLPKADREARVERILATLGLEDIANRKTDKLSGGQRQRIALARGLVVEPDILLLDEPLGALDANLRKAIQNELKLLQKNLGVTFIFVTHAQSEALAMSDRIVVMNRGRVEQISPPHELYTRPKTPFVAGFIGRNTIFEGQFEAGEGGTGTVVTALGRLRGRVAADIFGSEKAMVAVPTESLRLLAASATAPSGDQGAATNILKADIAAIEVVGHVMTITLTLGDGKTVRVETHIDKYAGSGLAPGQEVRLAFDPDEASIIHL